MREKLIELLENMTDKDGCHLVGFILAEKIADYLIANGVTVQEDCKACAEATQNCIVKLQEQIAELRSVQEWISVKDRLPEKDQYVWCYSNKYGGHFFMGYRGYYTGEWIENGCLHIGEVTHWMPLPQPPKGE